MFTAFANAFSPTVFQLNEFTKPNPLLSMYAAKAEYPELPLPA
jgi:hypothetical protein